MSFFIKNKLFCEHRWGVEYKWGKMSFSAMLTTFFF